MNGTEAIAQEWSAESAAHEAESESWTAAAFTEATWTTATSAEVRMKCTGRGIGVEAGAELIEAGGRCGICRGHCDCERTRGRNRIATCSQNDCDGATCCDDNLFHRKGPVLGFCTGHVIS